MSKYTTEVRFICEEAAGLEESVGYNDVANVIAAAMNTVMPSYPIFDESYRGVLNTKILEHYYTREIGFETVGLWKLKLHTKLNEIMPYYNKLYESANIEFDPLKDFDITEDRNGGFNQTVNDAGYNNVAEHAVTQDDIDVDTSDIRKFSDTPQGGLGNFNPNEQYLTDVTQNSGTRDEDNKRTYDNTSKGTNGNNRQINNTEAYINHRYGKVGGASYSKLLQEYRDTLINIDMMVINELDELFFQLW